MKPEKDDYVALVVGTKKHLAKVNRVTKKGYQVTVDGSHLATPSEADGWTLDATDDDILAVFGPNPEPGNAYGIKVEPYYTTITRKPWGRIHFFRDVKSTEWKALRKGLDSVAGTLRKYQLLEYFPIETQVKPAKGKYAGAYAFKPNKTDVLYLTPQEFTSTPYIVAHETGHYIWYNLLDQSWKAKWVKLYHKSVAISKVQPTKLKHFLSDLENSGEYVKNYRKNLEEKDQLIFDEIIKWVKNTHKLEKTHIDTLLDANESLEPYWPKTELDLSDMQIVISEYANKKPEEFFAEAFAFWHSDFELPSSVKKLVKKSVKVAGGFDPDEKIAEEKSEKSEKSKNSGSKKKTTVKPTKKKPKKQNEDKEDIEDIEETEETEDEALARRRKRRAKTKKAA